MAELLVIAGEASGDRAAAAVVSHLHGHHQVFGMGGAALERTGAELLADLRATTAMGVTDLASKTSRLLRVFSAVVQAAARRRPRAALLVNYSEFNARLAPRLHRLGVRVLWYGAPQVWAWRGARTRTLRPFVDRMAVMLPFEEPLWRSAGVDAHYVGHPAIEGLDLSAARARRRAREGLGLTERASAIAILPGSRAHEVERLLGPMLAAYEAIRHDRASIDGRVLLAASLESDVRERVVRTCEAHRVPVVQVDPAEGAGQWLPAFDASLCASGTASLEAALAGAVPVIAYRVDVVTELVARMTLRVANVALPNLLLGERVFTELLQRDVRPIRLVAALENALDRRETYLRSCAAVAEALGPQRRPSLEVATMLDPWLAAPVGTTFPWTAGAVAKLPLAAGAQLHPEP